MKRKRKRALAKPGNSRKRRSKRRFAMIETFFVVGIPKPAGSKRGFCLRKGGNLTGRVAIVDACKTSRDWKTTVSQSVADRLAARASNGNFPTARPVSLTLTFNMPRPKSHHYGAKGNFEVRKTAPIHHSTRPDTLKLARAVEDALTGILYRDDSQIVVELIEKRYATTPGVTITIQEVA